MAFRRKQGRIEPSFGAFGDSDADIRISADDRAVLPADPPAASRKRGADRLAAPAPEASRVRDLGSGRRGASGDGSGGGGRGTGFFRGGRGSDGGGGRPRRSLFAHLVRLCLILGFWGAVAAVGVVGWFAVKLPQEAWAIPARPPNVKILSVAGDLLADRGTTGGEAVALDRMSPYIPQAVMAIEDRRFYSHWGVDPIGILRAFSENVAAGDTVQGGSTLTQQLAKNIFLTPDQTLQRKIQEAILALWLEQKFTKDQILEMYLNRVYFGSGATGVQAAARRYFDKNADEVTLPEAAMLAGLLKAPSRLSPVRDPEAAQARGAVVLQAMMDEGFVTKAEFDAARAAKPTRARSFWTGAEHYAADMVMRDLPILVGQVSEDVVVDTTIDLTLEKAAEKAIRDTVDKATQNVSQGALVSIDGTGAVRAIVGGRDYAESQFNRAVDAKRQPGSSFKPFVYETALEYGVRPETVENDAPIRIGNWTPSNYDNRFRGPVTVADALMRSLNTVAVKLTADVGPAAVIETAKRMGITSPMTDNATIALGTSEVSLLELTGAYAPFANGGYQATPHLVNKVTTVSGKVLYERGAEVPPVIVTSDIVGMMNAMMTRVVTSGTGRRAALDGWQVAGKSGTTQDFKDAWFVGYTANLTTGVWLGNDNGAPMRQVTGGTLPADAWKSFMTAAHEGLPPTSLPGSYGIGDPGNALVASGGAPERILGYDLAGNPIYDTGELPVEDGTAQGLPPADPGVPVAAQPPADPAQDLAMPTYRRTPQMDGGGVRGAEPRYRDPGAVYEEPPVVDRGRRAPPADDPYGDDVYGGPPPVYDDREWGEPEYGEAMPMRRPAEIGPPRTVRRGDLPPDAVLEGPAVRVSPDQLPPDAVLEGPAPGGRSSDRSLFRGFFN